MRNAPAIELLRRWRTKLPHVDFRLHQLLASQLEVRIAFTVGSYGQHQFRVVIVFLRNDIARSGTARIAIHSS